MNPQDPDNRRKFARFKSDLYVRYSQKNGSEVKRLSKLVNVSEGGLQFSSREPLPVNTVLKMDIDGSHDQRPVSLHGKVVWVNPAPGGDGLYYSGVSFLDEGRDARAIILRSLD